MILCCIIKQGEFVQEYNLHEKVKHDEAVVVAFEVDEVQKANEIIKGKAKGNVIVASVANKHCAACESLFMLMCLYTSDCVKIKR